MTKMIRDNLIQTCCGQHLHVAQQNPDGNFGHGISFLNNSGSGTFGFGILVDGMNNATVQGNNLTMTQWPHQSCSAPSDNRKGIPS